MARFGHNPLAASRETQTGIEYFGVIPEPLCREIGSRVIALREILQCSAQPRLLHRREGIPFRDDAIQHVADGRRQSRVHFTMLDMDTLHILQMRIGRLEQPLGGQHLAATNMLFQPSQLARVQSCGLMGVFTHGLTPGHHDQWIGKGAIGSGTVAVHTRSTESAHLILPHASSGDSAHLAWHITPSGRHRPDCPPRRSGAVTTEGP